MPCFPDLKEKSYLFLCVKVQCFKRIGAIIINGGFSGGGVASVTLRPFLQETIQLVAPDSECVGSGEAGGAS